jgi:mannose-1-phosphate guanylyltransferase
MKLIVTAGGQGTKLWPYSREDTPKQFQPIIGDKSLYSYTISTLLKKYSPEDIYVSTKRKFIKYVSEQGPEIPLKNYIIEPDLYKNRGPSEGLAFLKMSMLHPDEPFFLVQVDDIRKPEDVFLQMIENCENLVKRDKKFISGGIKATEPVLGVDFLKLGNKLNESFGEEVYLVDEFVDRKSNLQETRDLIENYHIVVHSNHNCWYPDLMLDAYKKYKPEWYTDLMKMRDVIGKAGEDSEIEKIYSQMSAGPTEEVTKNVFKEGYIILHKFKWIDIGTWGSVYDYFSTSPEEVFSDGKVVSVASHGTYIKCNNKNKLVALAGVDDMIIVDTDDVLLVIPKNKIEKIKEIQGQLAQQGMREFL